MYTHTRARVLYTNRISQYNRNNISIIFQTRNVHVANGFYLSFLLFQSAVHATIGVGRQCPSIDPSQKELFFNVSFFHFNCIFFCFLIPNKLNPNTGALRSSGRKTDISFPALPFREQRFSTFVCRQYLLNRLCNPF